MDHLRRDHRSGRRWRRPALLTAGAAATAALVCGLPVRPAETPTRMAAASIPAAPAPLELSVVPVSLPAPMTPAPLRADAGEDVLGIVGRPVALDGRGSEPSDAVAYRWIQVAGPAVQGREDRGPTLRFVPPEVGTYRFVLVVAAGGAISEPDAVDVQVGRWVGPDGASATGSAPGFEPPGLDRVAQAALVSLSGGPDRGEELARVFEEVAGRVDLYTCYRDLFSELSRRLEGVVPADPAMRRLWLDRVFGPLTGPLVEALRRDGMDIASAEGQAATLNAEQRFRLAGRFRRIADGFRSAAETRQGGMR